MNSISLIFAALLAVTSTPTGFIDNLEEGFAQAKRENKLVFVCFSGSDWCGWCKKLEHEVFADPEFLPLMTNKFELVFIDLPQDRSVLSTWARTHNEDVVREYKIRGFPTCLIMAADGTLLERTGYQYGGGKKYAEYVDYLVTNRADLEKYIYPLQRELNTLSMEINRAYEREKEMCLIRFEPRIRQFVGTVKMTEVPPAIEQSKQELLRGGERYLEILDSIRKAEK